MSNLLNAIKTTLADKFGKFGFTKDMTDVELDDKLNEMPSFDEMKTNSDTLASIQADIQDIQGRVENIETNSENFATNDDVEASKFDATGLQASIDKINKEAIPNLQSGVDANKDAITEAIGGKKLTNGTSGSPTLSQSEAEFVVKAKATKIPEAKSE